MTVSWESSFEPASAFTCDLVVPGLFQGDFPEGDVDWDQFDDVVTMTAEDRPSVQLKVGGGFSCTAWPVSTDLASCRPAP